MATQAVVPGTLAAAVTATTAPIVMSALEPTKPVVPPAGSYAASGPTTGQLFPVGNR